MEINTPTKAIKVTNHPKMIPVLLVSLGVIAIVATGYGTYHWQHQKLVSANSQIDSQKSQVTALNGTIGSLKSKTDSLQSQYDQAKATINSYQAIAKTSPTSSIPQTQTKVVIATQADLTMIINGSQYVNPAGSVTENSKWFGVNVTLTNTMPSTVSINDADFHLKDLQSNEYTESTVQNASTLPADWTSLPNKTLAPGESIRGTVTFQMPSDAQKDFNFVNVTNVYPVHSSN